MSCPLVWWSQDGCYFLEGCEINAPLYTYPPSILGDNVSNDDFVIMLWAYTGEPILNGLAGTETMIRTDLFHKWQRNKFPEMHCQNGNNNNIKICVGNLRSYYFYAIHVLLPNSIRNESIANYKRIAHQTPLYSVLFSKTLQGKIMEETMLG